jgi:hypothetical protein
MMTKFSERPEFLLTNYLDTASLSLQHNLNTSEKQHTEDEDNHSI